MYEENHYPGNVLFPEIFPNCPQHYYLCYFSHFKHTFLLVLPVSLQKCSKWRTYVLLLVNTHSTAFFPWQPSKANTLQKSLKDFSLGNWRLVYRQPEVRQNIWWQTAVSTKPSQQRDHQLTEYISTAQHNYSDWCRLLLTEFLQHFLRQPIKVDVHSAILCSHFNGRLHRCLRLQRQMSFL